MKEQNSKAKKNKINFIIPDFLNVRQCVYLLDTFHTHKEVFKENVNILGFSGMFVGHSWNEKTQKVKFDEMNLGILEKMKKKYNEEYNTSLFIMFDKQDVTIKDLEDEYSNNVMKIFDDSKNYVFCKSLKLKQYIKENYKRVNIIDFYNPKEKKVTDYVIVTPEFNDLVISGKLDENQNVILIPDGGKITNRKWLFKHNKKEKVLPHLNFKKNKYYTKKNEMSFIEIRKQKEYLSFEDIKKISIFGLNTFMFSGFGVYNVAMYENYIDYIYKDEYKIDARNTTFNELLSLIEKEINESYNYRF